MELWLRCLPHASWSKCLHVLGVTSVWNYGCAAYHRPVGYSVCVTATCSYARTTGLRPVGQSVYTCALCDWYFGATLAPMALDLLVTVPTDVCPV